jgi:hypothetical protein
MSGVIDLDCGAYQVKAGSIAHGHYGYVFRCTISPVSEDVSSRLMVSARMGGRLRLVFPEQPILLERVEIERIDGVCVRVVGRVIDIVNRCGKTPGHS